MPLKHSPKNMEIDGTPTSRDDPVMKRKPESHRHSKRLALEMDEDDNSCEESILTLNDIMKEIKSNEAARRAESNGIRDDIALLRGEVNQQISGLKSSLESMTTKVNDLSTKVDGIDARVDIVTNLANENRKMMNGYKQDRLERFMEIDGIRNDKINNASDLKELAIEIVESFGININANEIEHAFKKEINLKKKVNGADKKTILTVIFANINSKIRIMKAKRALTDKSSIYFNMALTVGNRNLIHKAKEIVEGKLKVYFSRGCVRVLKKDKHEILVDDEAKLNEVQNYYDQIKTQQ